MRSSPIPFDEINRAALAGYAARLQSWFPAGKIKGHEFVMADLSGAAGNSLSINLRTGVWKEFAGGAGGADPVSLFAAAFHGGKQGAAAKALAAEMSLDTSSPGTRKTAPAGAQDRAGAEEKWFPCLPPANAPQAPVARYDSTWEYRGAAGELLGYVVRLDASTARPKKQIFGMTWGRRIWTDDKGKRHNETGWHVKHPARPMPLYGLDRLAARPSAPVLLVEGEKACDAATAMFPNHVCVTWPRGTENVAHVDWKPLAGRSVVVWPDNDAPGLKAAGRIAAELQGIAKAVVTLRVDDLAEGADAADIDTQDAAAWLAEHMPLAHEGDRETAAGKLKVILFRDIEAAIDANDFVEDLLIAGGMSVVYGEPNTGKTFLVLDLAFHVARGEPWFGREVEQGGVLYVALEGGIGIRNRIAAYREANELHDAEIQFALITQPISLLEESGVESLIRAITSLAARFEGKLKLIVIDTASRALAGGDENSSVDMGCLVANADIIRARTEAHIAFIHHSGKDAARGARGWSGLRGAIDTEIEVTEGNGARRVEIKKQRDLDKGPAFDFTLETVELGTNRRGKPVRSCIVSPAGGAGTAAPSDPARALIGHNRRAYEVLRNRIADEGASGFFGTPIGILSVVEQSWREAFYSGAMPGDEQAAKQKAFKRASKDLINKNLVAMGAGRVWIAAREQPGQDART